jgi:hypothetical protein
MFSSSLEVLSFVLQKEGNGVEGQLLISFEYMLSSYSCSSLISNLYMIVCLWFDKGVMLPFLDALEYGKKNKSVKRCQPCSNTQVRHSCGLSYLTQHTLNHNVPEQMQVYYLLYCWYF